MRTVQYGIFGDSFKEYDENGFTERLVIIQESGLYAGRPPDELRIAKIVPFDDEEFGKRWVAKLNRKTDLPYYLAKVKIKVIGELKKYTDADILKEGLEPIPDKV